MPIGYREGHTRTHYPNTFDSYHILGPTRLHDSGDVLVSHYRSTVRPQLQKHRATDQLQFLSEYCGSFSVVSLLLYYTSTGGVVYVKELVSAFLICGFLVLLFLLHKPLQLKVFESPKSYCRFLAAVDCSGVVLCADYRGPSHVASIRNSFYWEYLTVRRTWMVY